MKTRVIKRLRKTIIYGVVAVQVLFLSSPLGFTAYAQETTPETTSTEETTEPEPVCVAPANTRQPTGSAARTFVYNCDSGLWENTYYSWNPVNSVLLAKYTPEHRLNSTTGRYEVYEWVYSAPAEKYVYVVTKTYEPAPEVPVEPVQDTQVPTQDPTPKTNTNDAPAQTTTAPLLTQGASTGLGVSPVSITTYGSGANANLDVSLDADIANDIDSTATSGDVSVLQNTTAGDATSGEAFVGANIFNMLQSTVGWQGMMPEVYMADIQGDYFGDIILDHSNIASSPTGNCAGCNIDVNASMDASIVNDVNLLAESGNATVSGNTSAGDATSGDATAVANIVNMISSSIAAGESFIGVLNIHGNLEGDVLFADDVVDELIAANVPTVDIGLCSCDISADLDSNIDISNNITATAGSGNANVSNNTSAGDATSGDANTNVTVFNLTNRSVTGRDAILVFVNVSGEWIGFITDAPMGATAAMLGSDVSSNTFTPGGADIDANTNASIQNNINAAAFSGDAEVSYNTSAGDATSGDANANVNVSNIVNSNFGFSGWFRLLFINVFGDWKGSFGTNTQYGNPTPMPLSAPTPTTKHKVAGARTSGQTMRTFAVSFSANNSTDNTSPVEVIDAKEISAASTSVPSQADFGAPEITSRDFTLVALFLLIGIAYLVIFQSDLIMAVIRRRP